MRYYLRKTVIVVISFFAATSLINTVTIGQEPKNILVILGAFIIASILLKPIFNVVLLPANYFTYSLLLLILNTLLIFALIYLLPGFSVGAYHFPGTTVNGFVIPEASFSKLATAFLVAAAITAVERILHLIFH